MFEEKTITIEALTFNEAFEKAQNEYFWDIIEKGAKYGWPVIIEYGGFKPYCIKRDSSGCIDSEEEFIQEGEFKITLEELIPLNDDIPENVIDFIYELIELYGQTLKDLEKCNQENTKLKIQIRFTLDKINNLLDMNED